MGVDGRAAGQTLLGFGRVDPGYCLRYVWQAYKAHGASTGRSAPTATDAWYRSDGQHPGDRNPPAGVPVFWGPKASSAAGDVVISLGGGRVAATDYPRYGVVGTCTIDERERQIGRPYLGWTEAIFDQRIDYDNAGGPAGSEDDMDDRQNHMLEYLYEQLTPGIAGVKPNGGAYDALISAREAARAAEAHANAARIELVHPISDAEEGISGSDVTGKLRQRLAWIDKRGRDSEAREAALLAAVAALATSQGLDQAAVEAIIEKAVKDALRDVTITLKTVP